MQKESKDLVDFRLDSEGRPYFFGEHYNLKEARKLYKEEEPDEELVLEVVHCYVHFGIVWIDGERRQGWTIHDSKPNSMRGYKKATSLLFKRDREIMKQIKSKYCKMCKAPKTKCICKGVY